MKEHWKIQDIYHEKMKKDYENGIIKNPIYRPYFNWKFYGASLSLLDKETCYKIMKEAQKELDVLDQKYPFAHQYVLLMPTMEDVWKPYKGYGEDCYLYSYLIGIENEITKIMMR